MSLSTIIEPGIGQWRSAVIGEDELPLTLNYHEDVSLSAAGALFDARVTRVDHTLDMAFLDLGDGRDGMLNLRRAKLLAKGRVGGIGDCVTEGQRIRVQVVAEPSAFDRKSLPVTPRPRLAGRYVVAEAGGARLNFSKDLDPKVVKSLTPLLTASADKAALIIRARAGDVPPDAVAREAEWLTGILSAPMGEKPGLTQAFSPLEQALIGVVHTEGGLYIEGGDALAKVKAAAGARWPDLKDSIRLYQGQNAMFEAFGVEEAIEEALAERIDLPSGGWISITETQALTVVDVNMGGALKGRSASEAKLVVNLEAALATAYHLRFQDIGGLVVVDFIDMSAKGAAKELTDLLDGILREDDVPVQRTGISMFGLVELNRKRSGLSLRSRLMQPRAAAERPSAMALALIRRADRLGRTAASGALTLSAPRPVLDWFESHPAFLETLKTGTQRAITLTEAAKADVYLG